METMIVKLIVCLIAGAGAGFGTGLAGVKFIFRPAMSAKESNQKRSREKAFTAFTGAVSHFAIGAGNNHD